MMSEQCCTEGGCGGKTLAHGLCSMHYARVRRAGLLPRPKTVEQRFWVKVQGGDVDTCWEWTASLMSGYGSFSVSGVTVGAHRWAYESLRAPIPDGLFLDHLCRNTSCVNPWHLEPVTNRENVLRGVAPERTRALAAAQTHCARGHEWTPENTVRRCDGRRSCRTCRNAKWRRWAAKGRAVA